MTKPSVSIRELLDESLVEQLTGELAAPPKQGVLLHRIALAAACLLLVAGIAGVGLWASRQSPAILGPTSAVSEEASSPSSSDDWQRMLAAMLPPTQAAQPETGDTLPVAERPLLTMEEMRGRLQDFCREQGLIILEETTSPVCVSMGEDLRYILARVADNPLAISQLSVTPSGSISVGVSQPVLGSVGGFSRPILPPEGTDMAAPGALTKLARSYYERFRALCPMDEVAVEAWTEGYLSYPEGAADPVVSPVYHVTVYPKTAAPLQALGAAGLAGMRLDIEADGSLSAITLPAGYAHGQIRQAAALTPDEAVSLWEQGTYLHMYPPAYMEEPPRERARVLRVRLEYWEQADQAVRLPVYILYVAAGAHEDVFRYAVPAVSAADADWNDLRLYINDGTVRGTWVRDE